MFQFTDDCLIGIDSLDDDHRYLFELINRVLELLKEEPTAERQTQVNAILDKLTAYADHHFIKEEEYMEQIRDPELLKQRAQHEFFRQKLAEIQRSSQITGSGQTQTLTELMNFLAKWLYHHILGSDIMSILGELEDYTKFHFSEEEEYMESIHYEGLEAQKRAHAAFIDRLEQVDPDEIDANPQEYLNELLEFLLNWLINHILYTDKKIPDVTK